MTFRLKDLGFKTFFLHFPAVMVYILLTDSDGCGDLPRDFRFFPIAGASALLLAIIWSLIDKQRRDYNKLQYLLQITLRFFLAYTIMQYGAAKVLDVQFNSSISSLDTKVVDMQPMSVAWSFFGYSFPYEFFIGCSQIAAALLLLFRRTTTLGAIVMVTIMSNIVFVNFAFDVCVKFFSSSYLAMSLYLLVDDAGRLTNVLLLNRAVEKRTWPQLFRKKIMKKVAGLTGILLGFFAIAYPMYDTVRMREKYGVGKHTALYGVWSVDSLHHSRDSMDRALHADVSGWRQIIFEDYDNASIKSWTSTLDYLGYGVDTAKHTLHMNRTYPDTLLAINSTYRLDKDTLYLRGKHGEDSLYVRLHLRRKYFRR
ncbi:DoxX family protein [Flavitalea sp. BT771]|uniref:DoxX family protein n=1 Tax=Flavitalea sp. BT771 TaxID=3063329 RepID=UPI0026E29304|nr:DoxX family protein [Flavitalea sp. BT771]MDO6431748.1 DoxX family protein [Flavitalea sp. BT771]MDV6220656.1 DoxX family protein [Flavitalea sp. BT771]